MCTFRPLHLHLLSVWPSFSVCVVENFPVLQHSLCLVLHLSTSFLSGSLLLLSSSPEPPFTRDLLLMEMITSRSPVRSSPSLSEFIFVWLLSPQACGPQYGYMCGQQQYISGVCANVSPSFQILNSIAPGVQSTPLAWVTRSCPAQNMTRLYKLSEQDKRLEVSTDHSGTTQDPGVKLTLPYQERKIRAFFFNVNLSATSYSSLTWPSPTLLLHCMPKLGDSLLHYVSLEGNNQGKKSIA